jgi:hypothetical protein
MIVIIKQIKECNIKKNNQQYGLLPFEYKGISE